MTSTDLALIGRWTRGLAAAALLALVTGCATRPGGNPVDPFESFNRPIATFNDRIDDAVVRPVAETYTKVLPSVVRTGINNFFGNLGEVWNFANGVMQLKLKNSAESFMRFNVNTVFGLGGLLDIATEAGIDRHNEDFGQTLGRWGVPSGPYVVLPLLGPSTVRDTLAFPIDRFGDPMNAVNDIGVRNSLRALELVDLRASLLRAGRLLDDAALDKYSFTRDAWLQRRRSEVYDGNVPESESDK
ncbi:MAG: VacJ family lipoprotein [Comamonadaceae bacterium]|nr:MAG: VacJ family lipoprotein [Comamonadaceae bacterium]